MTPDERAASFRFRAAMFDVLAARDRLAAEAVLTTEALRKFGSACQAGFDQEVADHPGLAELNVRMDALYGPT